MDKKNNITGINRREAAMENFLKGYNCTQSVLLAFEDLLPMENRKEIICMASSFGGGMGRLREVCGSVSGMFLVAGLLYGYEGPETGQKKTELYTRIQELAHRFEEQNGSIVCRELLGLDVKREKPVPEARTDEYYKKRPCKELIGMAAGILEDFINGNQADA
ncbi:MAG: C-GCAxxG-C-C family protein [Lachnospiraceae bacterium]